MACRESWGLFKLCIGSIDSSGPFVTAHRMPVLTASALLVVPIWRDRLDTLLVQPAPQWGRVWSRVGDCSFRLRPGVACNRGDTDVRKFGFRKRSSTPCGAFTPDSQRKTLNVDPTNHFVPLPSSDSQAAPGLLGRREAALQEFLIPLQHPSQSSTPSNLRQTSSSSHCISGRQQVDSGRYMPGRHQPPDGLLKRSWNPSWAAPIRSQRLALIIPAPLRLKHQQFYQSPLHPTARWIDACSPFQRAKLNRGLYCNDVVGRPCL